MNIKKQFIALAAVIAVLLSSCGKAPGFTKYIPKDAGSVISVDVRSIVSKLEKDSLNIENLLATMKDSSQPDQYTKAIAMYKEFKDAGIDWSDKVYLCVGGLGSMASATSRNNIARDLTFQLVAGMSDQAKFEAFLKKQSQTDSIREGDGFRYTSHEGFYVGWNKEVLMLVAGSNGGGSSVMNEPDVESRPKGAASGAGPLDQMQKYFKMSKSESIASVEGFKDVQAKKSDIAIFSQLSVDGINAIAFSFVPGIHDLLEDCYSYSTINFEDGKLVAESSSFVGKKLGDILKKYAGPEVNLDLIDHYPSQNVDGTMLFSFNPQIIPALIRESKTEPLLGLGLAKTGLTLDDLGKIFKGEFGVVVSDFTMERKEMGKDAMNSMSKMPTAKLIFTAKIGDKAIFDKLVAFGQSQGMLIRNGNTIMFAENGVPATGFPVAISAANDQLTIATDSASLVAYLAKTEKIGLPGDAKGKLKGNAIAGFIDINKVLNGFSQDLFDTSDVMATNMLAKTKGTFSNGYFTMSNFNGKSIDGKAELIFADNKTNSLSQLVKFAMYGADQSRADKIRMHERWSEHGETDVILDSVPSGGIK